MTVLCKLPNGTRIFIGAKPAELGLIVEIRPYRLAQISPDVGMPTHAEKKTGIFVGRSAVVPLSQENVTPSPETKKNPAVSPPSGEEGPTAGQPG